MGYERGYSLESDGRRAASVPGTESGKNLGYAAVKYLAAALITVAKIWDTESIDILVERIPRNNKRYFGH